MKSYLIPAFAFGLLASSVSAQGKLDLTNPKQKDSYAIGVNISANLKSQEVDLDPAALAAGIADGFAGKPTLSQDEIKAAMMDVQKGIASRALEKQKTAGEKNLKEGEAFRAANGKKDGVKTLASGLEYKVLKSGTGPTPKKTDTVKVHYHGTLIDGTVFDSSVQRGEPVSLGVTDVIPGWIEALQLMKVGDKWQLVIPPDLAYGERGAGGVIGPNSTLIFEVELLGVEGAK